MQIERATSEIQSSKFTAQIVSDISNLPKTMKTVDLTTIQTILGKIKFKRRVQNFKIFGKIVAATTIGDYLVNLDLWIISSLSDRLFDNRTNMLNSSRCLDFPNGKYMYF